MQVVYNLYPISENHWLPAAYLAQVDRDGRFTYLSQRAIPATCAPYNIEIEGVLAQMLDLIELLSPKKLEARFKPVKSKSAIPLAQLLDPKSEVKVLVEGFIHRHLSQFLDLAVRHSLPLALDAERKTILSDVMLQTGLDDLVPHQSFKKTVDGIEYRFQLGTETEKWTISQHTVIPLTNTDPAWTVVHYALFRVPGINGNMLRPFFKKDMLQIPADKMKVYFRNFIARSAGRNQIEAEGFEVQTFNTLNTTQLVPVEDVLSKQWVLKPVFDYHYAQFFPAEKRDHVTTVHFMDETEEILVRKVSRDTALEQRQLEHLVELGLSLQGRTFQLNPEGAQLEQWIEWLCTHETALLDKGFSPLPPQIGERTVALLAGRIEVRTTAQNDWFDVHGSVQAGAFSFPFRALVQHLRKRDPYFRLPDGTYFLIPEAWFTQYSDLAGSLQEGADEHTMRLPKALFTLLQDSTESAIAVNADELPFIDPELIDYEPDSNLKATLRPYQLSGVKWLIGHYQHGFGACLADSMGLGKTLQTIAVLLHAKRLHPVLPPVPEPDISEPSVAASTGMQLDLFNTAHQHITSANSGSSARKLRLPDTYPALIVLPASLVFNWQRELARFAPSLQVLNYTGANRAKEPRSIALHDVVLTTYHTARQDLSILEKIKWHFIILDESQQIKNRDSEISKVVRSLKAPHKISLSGTPIENSLADLWTQMEFINPATLGSYAHFREQFQVPIEKQGDQRAHEQLLARVRPFFLRRTKEQVANDLPPCTEQVFYCEMTPTQRQRYEQIKSAVRNDLLQLVADDNPQTRFLAIQALTRLRQIANHPQLAEPDYEGDAAKPDDVLAQLDTIRREGQKVLVFSSFEQHLWVYRRAFEAEQLPFAWLTGSVPQRERADIVERFQTDASVQVLFSTIKAGGVGLNLTAASYVFILDPWWNPASEDQAISRAHRSGQTQPVLALRFITRDTVEEKIRHMQERKKSLSAGLFDPENELPELNREELEELLR
jgi:SNF2-related domain/Helicase conserved C-terminal domain